MKDRGYIIGCIDDFRVFRPSSAAADYDQRRAREAEAANAKWLAQAGEFPEPPLRLTGSFIYAHPPDYRGRPALDYAAGDWGRLFREMKGIGMDTVVLQAAAWMELEECYYRSRRLSAFRTWDVVEPLVEAAAGEGMALFLGGLGTVSGWTDDLSDERIRRETELHLGVFRELSVYRDALSGFYYAPETAFTGPRNREREQALNRLYRGVNVALKEEFPGLKIMQSPATSFSPGQGAEMREAWKNVLSGVPLDILAPQDSIGTGGNLLQNQEEAYAVWKEVCEARACRLWANIELFRRSQWGTDSDFEKASEVRIRAQMHNASAHCEKLICWEAPYFLLGD